MQLRCSNGSLTTFQAIRSILQHLRHIRPKPCHCRKKEDQPRHRLGVHCLQRLCPDHDRRAQRYLDRNLPRRWHNPSELWFGALPIIPFRLRALKIPNPELIDHHDVPLHYRVSQQGVATNPASYTWSTALFGSTVNSLPGATGIWTPVTYPRFERVDNDLFFELRIGA